MTFRAYYLFNGYPVTWETDGYSQQRIFTRRDRVIRHRAKGQRNVVIHDLPDNRAEWDEQEVDYLYVATAEELRRRLCRMTGYDHLDPYSSFHGYDRLRLEIEFERYKRAMLGSDAPKFRAEMYDNTMKLIPERADALRATTLDDWLVALKEIIRSGASRVKNYTSPATPTGPTFDTKALADIILTSDYPWAFELKPYHELWGFPCSTFQHLAVAMLEVIPADAECVLDVTELVENDRVYCFEDLILESEVQLTA